MFGKSTPKQNVAPTPPPRPERKEQSFLQNGVRIEGVVHVEGDLRVEGQIDGTVNVKGVLMIGQSADTQGSINGGEVVIHGKVTGDVRAETRIQLSRGADVTGDLYCRSLVIEEGVVFEGRSHMGEKTGSSAARVDDHLKKRPEMPGQTPKSSPVFQSGQSKAAEKPGQMNRGSDKMFQR